MSGRRVMTALIAATALASLMVLANRYARSAIASSDAARLLQSGQVHGPKGVASQAHLEAALATLPNDPVAHEMLALLIAKSTRDASQLSFARDEMQRAISSRPGSGYSWASLASIKYSLGETDQSFEVALRNAVALAPFEPEVQRDVMDFGLAVLDEVTPATQMAIERAIEHGVRRNAAEALQIASRRGRLASVCRHWDVTSRPKASKWTQLCQSMEATS